MGSFGPVSWRPAFAGKTGRTAATAMRSAAEQRRSLRTGMLDFIICTALVTEFAEFGYILLQNHGKSKGLQELKRRKFTGFKKG